MSLRTIVLALALLLCTNAQSQSSYSFDYNSRCQSAYNAFLSLQIAEGNALIDKERKENPGNLLAHYIADYGDVVPLLLNGDPKDLREKSNNMDLRINAISKADNKNPWQRFSKASIYLHWALVRLRTGDQWKASTLFRKSYALVSENARKFPTFAPNQILLGLQEAAVGSLPEDYKWITSLLGLQGNVKGGTARIVDYLKQNPAAGAPLKEEALLYSLYLRFYLLTQQKEVWAEVSTDQRFPVKANLLRAFVRANIALNYRKADVAIQTLQDAEDQKNYALYPSFDYEMGNGLLMKLDPACVTYYTRFIRHNTGGLFSKDAYQKLALASFLQNNMKNAAAYRQNIKQVGSVFVDADKGAQRFANETTWPNLVLLQARLLIDGGYNSAAMTKLKSVSPAGFTTAADKTEYYFRLGRVYDETGDDANAVQAYQKAVYSGQNRPEHFASRSALQMAFIYEQHGQKAEAIKYYQRCLAMRNHDFQASIDQQAKAGLSRLGVK